MEEKGAMLMDDFKNIISTEITKLGMDVPADIANAHPTPKKKSGSIYYYHPNKPDGTMTYIDPWEER